MAVVKMKLVRCSVHLKVANAKTSLNCEMTNT